MQLQVIYTSLEKSSHLRHWYMYLKDGGQEQERAILWRHI